MGAVDISVQRARGYAASHSPLLVGGAHYELIVNDRRPYGQPVGQDRLTVELPGPGRPILVRQIEVSLHTRVSLLCSEATRCPGRSAIHRVPCGCDRRTRPQARAYRSLAQHAPEGCEMMRYDHVARTLSDPHCSNQTRKRQRVLFIAAGQAPSPYQAAKRPVNRHTVAMLAGSKRMSGLFENSFASC